MINMNKFLGEGYRNKKVRGHSLPVTPIGEWSDDKTTCVTQVLISIFQHGVDHTSHHLALL